LEKTLNGILNNLDYFSKAGISPLELVVTVIYDGMDKINYSHDNAINMFGKFKEYDDVLGLGLKNDKGKTMKA